MVQDYGNLKSVLEPEEKAASRLNIDQELGSPGPQENKVKVYLDRVFSIWGNQAKKLLARLPQTVTIRDMEINLTEIWLTLTAPIRWLWSKLTGKAKSRRETRLNKRCARLK